MRTYQQYLITDLCETEVYGAVWLDVETMEVDQSNLPRPSELAAILKAMAQNEVKARPTNNLVKDE